MNNQLRWSGETFSLAMIMAFYFLLTALIFGMVFLWPATCLPDIIWQIGDINDNCGEFTVVDQKIIAYQVPADWQERLGNGIAAWDDFPAKLYPTDDQSQYTQELRIHFSLLKPYPKASLRIIASASSKNAHNYLEVCQGENPIGWGVVEMPLYTFFDFTLVNLKEGQAEENTIIIRNILSTERGTYPWPILFDAIKLEHHDSDGDGVCDPDEGEKDWDGDGVADYLDQDTVLVPLLSDDPQVVKKILMDLIERQEEDQEEDNHSPLSFQEVSLADPNALNFPARLREDRFLRYGIIGFTIEGSGLESGISLVIGCQMDQLYPSLRFYACQGTGTDAWQEIPYQVDKTKANMAVIDLFDGGLGDSDEVKNGRIKTYLAPSYPRSLNLDLEKRGCFIEAIGHNHRLGQQVAHFQVTVQTPHL